jgi:protein-L-isoaspartate(D-aspartate) O-methyltransferase
MNLVKDRNNSDPVIMRAAMVNALRDLNAITSYPVAAAFSAVPRHVFAGGEPLDVVYDANTTLAPKVGADGQELSVISAAHIQAVMLEQAEVRPGMNVLEIGTGGYNAALIAELVGPEGSVTSVDIDPEIVTRARVNLKIAGYDRIVVLQADAEHEVPENAPYDRIIVTAGAWDISRAWLDQLCENGRIVVPLRFAGITRLVAFDRSSTGLVSHSYRLGVFVPMQGDGSFDDQLVPINGEVALRLDQQQAARLNVPALGAAVRSPRIERWSGSAFDLPDELELFLVTSTPQTSLLYVSEDLVQQDIFAASAARGVPALIDGGTFAYRTKRVNERTGGFESGVFAHGPDAEAVAARYVDLLRHWASDYRRRGAARIEYHPKTTVVDEQAGWHTKKRNGTVTVTWP